MFLVDPLDTPLGIKLDGGSGANGLTVVTPAENLGHLIASGVPRAERRNIAASGFYQTGKRSLTVADEDHLSQSAGITRADQPQFHHPFASQEGSSRA